MPSNEAVPSTPASGGRRSRYQQLLSSSTAASSGASPETPAPAKGSNEPDRDSKFYQQVLPAWYPIRSDRCVTISLLITGLIMLIIGIAILVVSDRYAIEIAARYDNKNAGGTEVTLKAPKNMPPPLFLYYRLDGFYQNYRIYAQSRSDEQHHGDKTKDISSCEPLAKYEKKLLYPCGLIANSMFNDTLTVPGFGGFDEPTSKDVLWDTDKLKYSLRKADPNFNETSVGPGRFELPAPAEPPMAQWLRVGAGSSFKKLYRISPKKGLKAGEELKISINSVFPASGFEKWVVVSTTSFMGGSQLYLGWLYVIFGSLVLTSAAVLGCLARRAPEDRVRYFYSAAEAYDGVGNGGDCDDEPGQGQVGDSYEGVPPVAAPA